MIKMLEDISDMIRWTLGEIDLTDVWVFPGMSWPVVLDRRWFEDELP